jgi:hypothetical protein
MIMKQYCKAYYLADLRRFPGWREPAQFNDAALTETSVVYLCDDLTVVLTPVSPGEGVLWDSVTEDWEKFCRTTLEFTVPEYAAHD